MAGAYRYRLVVGREGDDPPLIRQIQRLRKAIFIDAYGWDLPSDGDREVDEFDGAATVHAVLFDRDEPCATFRANPTDRPYLAADVFPSLAVLSPYPRRADAWEISRFGVVPGSAGRTLASLNYAAMFWLAHRVEATSLVAIADLTYERFLRTIGIRTRRYGPPGIVGHTRDGTPLQVVAGEIAIAAQNPARVAALLNLMEDVEIFDALEVCGPARVSA